jgi:hypothetical protein
MLNYPQGGLKIPSLPEAIIVDGGESCNLNWLIYTTRCNFCLFVSIFDNIVEFVGLLFLRNEENL